jgi:hypothetical protein
MDEIKTKRKRRYEESRIKRVDKKDFGRLCIDLIALNKNRLKLYRRCYKLYDNFNEKIISDNLKYIYLDILNDNKFNEGDYKKLDDNEKKIFDDVLYITQVQAGSSISMLRRHKKYDDDEINTKLKRFNLLKGQILAGNDNREIIKELKKLIIYLKSKNILHNADIGTLLYYIVCILEE